MTKPDNEPLGADAQERPTLAEVRQLWAETLSQPVPAYPLGLQRLWERVHHARST